jgi:choline monooxygenase
MPIFDIHADITRARTIPSEFYTSREHFELSKEKIFARTWQLAGYRNELSDLTPVNFLEGFLDEPLLITSSNGKLACVSNVCTHRGMILVDEPCSGDLIRCGYHGRRFDLNGKYLSMPEFDGVKDFPAPSDDLRNVALAEWNDFIFASLDANAPFTEYVVGLESSGTDIPGLERVSAREYEVKAHWALYCENYLEGFHIPFVHRSLNEVVDYGTYTTDTFRYTSVQTGYDSGGKVAGRYFFMFPNTMFNFYPWGVSVNIVTPVSPGQCTVKFLSYVSDDTALGTGAGADLHRVEMEDEKVVEQVQKGIRSRFYDRGRYSPRREQGTHHFHRLIAEFME